jgi:hypothetical protein
MAATHHTPVRIRHESPFGECQEKEMFNQLHPMAEMAMPNPRKALAITVVLPEGDDAGAALHRADVALGDVGLNMVAFYTTTHYDETARLEPISYGTPPPADWAEVS